MNIKEEILKEHSKKQTMKIVDYIGNDKKKFGVLMNLFLKNEHIIAQRASWVVSYSAIQHPELIMPYLKKMVLNLNNPGLHNAVVRNTIKILQFIDIPVSLLGIVAEICFKLLASQSQPVAIKVFSMTVLLDICKKEPELKRELKLVIEAQMPYESAAFTSRGKKALKDLI